MSSNTIKECAFIAIVIFVLGAFVGVATGTFGTKEFNNIAFACVMVTVWAIIIRLFFGD